MATQTGSERVKEEDPQRQTTEKELATVRSPESLHSSSNDSGIPARGTNPTKECASLVSRVCEVITRVYNTEEYIFTYGRSQHLCVCMYVYVCKYNKNIASNKSYRSKRKQKKTEACPRWRQVNKLHHPSFFLWSTRRLLLRSLCLSRSMVGEDEFRNCEIRFQAGVYERRRAMSGSFDLRSTVGGNWKVLGLTEW